MASRKIQILPLDRTPEEPLSVPKYSLAQLLFNIEVLRGEVLIRGESAAEKSEVSSRLDEMKSFLIGLEKEKSRETAEKAVFEDTLDQEITFPGFIGNNSVIRHLVEESARWAATPYPVLITGESGTGKEMFARLIHQISKRKLFLPVNCSAIPASLIESELFGHTKGAFTGAHQSRAGKFEEADGGTIFLDEIGELEDYIQVKLLRVIQFGELQRVGSDKVIKVDARVIAATNFQNTSRITNGKLREDLYYRLACCELKIPPLRERRDEIPDLLQHFMAKCSSEVARPIPSLSKEMQTFLYDEYRFPGNIRELENIARRIVVLGDQGLIRRKLMNEQVLRAEESISNKLADKVRGMTKETLRSALEMQSGSVQKSAAVLGISQSRLYQLCRKFQLKPSQFHTGKHL